MLPGVKDEAVVEVNPRVTDGLAALQDEMIDSGPCQFPRRRQSGRTGTDDDCVVKFDGCASARTLYAVS